LKDVQSIQESIARNPLKPPDTSSPRATLKSFLDNTNSAYRLVMAAHKENMGSPGLFTSESIHQMERHADQLIQRAVYCLNLSEVPDALKRSWGIEGALFLKEIFDRIDLPPFAEIPDTQAIETEIERKKITDPLRRRLPDTQIVIAMVEDGTRKGEFLFAPEIIPRLDQFIEKVKHLPYKAGPAVSPDFLKFYDSHPGGLVPPKWSQWIPTGLNAMYLFNTIWQWGFVIGLLLVTFISIWAFYRWWNRRADKSSAVKRTAVR